MATWKANRRSTAFIFDSRLDTSNDFWLDDKSFEGESSVPLTHVKWLKTTKSKFDPIPPSSFRGVQSCI